MITIYGMSASGNCYKLKLLAELLQIHYQWVEVDILKDQTHTDDFLKKNQNAKVPVLETENNEYLPESNAGLYYLAKDSSYFPQGRLQESQVLQWMFFEQYSHEPAIAVARFIKKFLPEDHPRQIEIEALHKKGYAALNVMENHLKNSHWFVGEKPSIADIALFAYTHIASDGGFDLSRFPEILSWIQRIEDLPNYCPMEY